MSRIKMLLWDIDGTILDFHAAEKAAIRTCFDVFGFGECTDEMLSVYSSINKSYWERLERGEMTKHQILIGRFEEFFGTYGLDTNKSEEFNEKYQFHLGDTIVFHKNAVETLTALKGKYLQCAVTNGTKAAQERKLSLSGLDKIFDHIFISEEIGCEKPEKGFFDAVFRETRIPSGQTMIIGDSLTSDIKGGTDSGIITCWYDPENRNDSTGLKANYVIHDLAEIPMLL